jgi:hypothetical protein
LVPYASVDALSLFTDAQVTKIQSTKILSQAKMKNCTIYPSYQVIKSSKEEYYSYKGKMLIYKSLVAAEMQVLMDTTASRIIMAQKMPYTLFWTMFRKNSFSFQNEVVMEALDTADTSYCHWKML